VHRVDEMVNPHPYPSSSAFLRLFQELKPFSGRPVLLQSAPGFVGDGHFEKCRLHSRQQIGSAKVLLVLEPQVVLDF